MEYIVHMIFVVIVLENDVMLDYCFLIKKFKILSLDIKI